MAGMEFEYDEKGGTFYYFLLSFLALILIPATHYLWPRKEQKENSEKLRKKCTCYPCKTKEQRIQADQPMKNAKRIGIKVGLIIGWLITAYVAYKASQVELDFTEFDPFAELEIDRGASDREIRRAYRQLTLVWHPDKETGDHKKFMRITKAYKALTDEEARKNWEMHGNPDGPGATTFGIALPKWIVERENSMWVLAAYGLVFMVILPIAVGSWWYRSIQFSADQILMDTTQLYVHFFQKTPNMMLKRVVMILGSSMEFEKGHNNEVVMRVTDNEEIPMLIRDLPHLMEKNKEKPLCYPFSVKARALLHAHFARLPLPQDTLEFDKQYVLKKCPYLLNEMINIVAQLVAWYHLKRVSRLPRLDTLENVMKVSQMCVQGLWDNKSPLLQLPHIHDDMLRHFTTKRRNIRSVRQFVMMKNDDRRDMLRSLSEQEYRDVMNVAAAMPYVTMEVHSQVIDEEDQSITASSIVTVTVTLKRQSMETFLNKEGMPDLLLDQPQEEQVQPAPQEEEQDQEDDEGDDESKENATESPLKKEAPKAWKQNKNKKKGKNKKGGKKTTKPQVVVQKTPVLAKEEAEKGAGGDQDQTPNKKSKKSNRVRKDSNVSTEEEMTGSEGEDNEDQEDVSKEEDEEEWQKFQQDFKKENQLEAKSKKTYEVHCPYFPVVKYEWWWLYIADRKNHALVTAPIQVCSLLDSEEVQLKFYAPPKPGQYQYSVNLKSDSYFDSDLHKTIKLDVKEKMEVKNHPQWDIPDDEEDKDVEEVTESDDDSYDESDDD